MQDLIRTAVTSSPAAEPGAAPGLERSIRSLSRHIIDGWMPC